MKIGTALTAGATRVLLLGSGELGKEVTIALQRYGVEVIAADRYEHAPAQHVAHWAHVLNMADAQNTKALVERERPAYIVPEIEAIATSALEEIEQKGIAEVIPTAKAVRLTMDREGIRRLVAEQLGVPTSRYAFAASYEALQQAVKEGIGYPCFVKPTMSSSGKGQSRVEDETSLAKAWEYARSGGRVDQGRVIVESMVDFDFEITLLTVRALNEKGEVDTYFCDPIGHRQQAGDYVESWQPQPLSEAAKEKAQQIAKTVTAHLGGRGVFGVELFIQGDQVWFSEVSPRPHDTGMVTMISQRQSEFELHARAILGLPVDTASVKPGASAVIYGGRNEFGIAYADLDKALAVPETEVRLFGKPLALMRRRMGVALAAGSDIEQARERAKRAASLVKPVALNGGAE